MDKSTKYTEQQLQEALQAIKDGSISKKHASRLYKIPRQTLQYRLSEKFKTPGKGPSTILSEEEESMLVKWILESSRKGFPRRQLDLQSSVQEYLNRDPSRETPFVDNRPGLKWFKSFMRRHPNVSFRTSEAVTQASSTVSENDIRGWFANIQSALEDENALDILDDPTRIFNGDETNFLLCPNTGRVLTMKGNKNVYEVDSGQAKTAITVMFTFSASGEIVYPMIIYPYKRLPSDIFNTVPKDWGVGRSESGWMKAETFFEYIGNIFIPYIEEKDIKKPVILFVDGHKSHLTLQVSQLCSEAEIILIALYPNSTRILQPADVAAFYPIKQGWKKVVNEWKRYNPNGNITKQMVGPFLQQVLDHHICNTSFINGFRACGLYPWNPEAIDYSKCLGATSVQLDVDNSIASFEKDIETSNKTLNFSQFRDLAGNDLIESLYKGNINENFNYMLVVHKIFNYFTERNIPSILEDMSNNSTVEVEIANKESVFLEETPVNNIDINTVIIEPTIVEQSSICLILGETPANNVDVNTAVIESTIEVEVANGESSSSLICEKTPISNIDVNTAVNVPTTNVEVVNGESLTSLTLQETSIDNLNVNTPVIEHTKEAEATDFQNRQFPEDIQSSNSQEAPTLPISCSKLQKILTWPETPKRKGKKNSERIPYVISSSTWQALHEDKENRTQAKLLEKEQRKALRGKQKIERQETEERKREENKQLRIEKQEAQKRKREENKQLKIEKQEAQKRKREETKQLKLKKQEAKKAKVIA